MFRRHFPLIIACFFLLSACLASFTEAAGNEGNSGGGVESSNGQVKNRKKKQKAKTAIINDITAAAADFGSTRAAIPLASGDNSNPVTNPVIDYALLSRFNELNVIIFESLEDTRFKELLYITRNHKPLLFNVLEQNRLLIRRDFLAFWDIMMAMPSEDVNEAMYTRLHQSVHWAFEYFRPIDQEHVASFCLFHLLLNDPTDPLPESMVQSVLELPGIDLNASRDNSCIALFTLGVPSLPAYYPNLILSDPRLDVNCIVPATVRRCRHISCHVPDLPLFWHALIYQNYHAAWVLFQNRNLHVLPLIPSFFVLLRLFLIFGFYFLLDGNVPKISNDRYEFERIIF